MYIFGGGKRSKVKPQYTGLATQTSTTTVPVTIGLGLNRAAPNIVWQGDFQSHKQTQKTGKGGGRTVTGYTYSGSFELAIGWGPVTAIRNVWKDQSKVSLASLGMTLIAGNVPQAPWGYLASAHPSEALGYSGIALAVVPNYDLGSSNTLGQHAFEVEWPLLNTAPGGTGDADPAQCVDMLLNSNLYGALMGQPSFPLENVFSTGAATTTGDAAFQTYCKALGLGMSPLLDSQESCNSILERWATLFNTMLCWTGYSLQFLPYGSETTTANGVTYLPDTSAKFAFADNDFLANGTDDPIILRRKAPADAFNIISLEITARANDYNTEPVEWHDQGLIDVYGMNPQSSTQAHEICERAVAVTCAQLLGQRTAYVRNEFEFVVSYAKLQLTVGTIGTVTDPRLGTVNVMITNIEEQGDSQDKGSAGFRITAEEYADSLGALGTAPSQGVTNTPVNTGIAAAAVNTPLIFEPPSTLAGATAQVWFAVSAGPGGTFDPNWGGCFVWLSSDNVTYQQVGTIETPARMGVLGGTLASYGGANPDTTHNVAVDLSESAGTLTGVTAADAAAFVTLSVIKDAGGSLEFLSYRDATLTSTYHYTLGGQLYRGLYGTAAAGHVAGAQFARLDENIFKFDLPAAWIGKTIYAKFQSFNSFGAGVQDISACTAYSYTPAGTGFGGGTGGVPTTPTTPTVSAQSGFNFVTWTANPASDNIVRYDICRAAGSGASFGTATLIGSSSGTSYTDGTVVAGSAYTYFVVAVNAVGSSTASTGTSITSAANALAVLRLYGATDGRQPDPGEVLFEIEMLGGETFPAGFTSNLGGCDVAPTGSITCTVFKNGSSVGSMNIAAGATAATWTLASPLSFAAGDKMKFTAPATQDATLSGLYYTFAGGR
jgi:hypothetical protein